MKKYVKMLKKHGLKVTPQRIDILRYLDENRTHPTAENIYSSLKKKTPSLSKATVYNTLNVLSERGIIQEITITSTEHRYDFKTKPHHHFLCKKCGKIFDIDIECPYLGKVKEEHEIDEVHGYFKGVCKDCSQRKRR